MQENLKKLINKYIREVLDEEGDLDEITTTADVDGYSTPFAFSEKKKSKKIKKISTNSTGYKIVKEGLEAKDLQVIRKLIRDVVGDVLRDIWLKRASWK